MKKSFYAFKAVLAGLAVAQMLATLHVYTSNAGLFELLQYINDAGYLAVPNKWVMSELKTFKAAFFGGMFFTLTVGASLSLLSFAAAWIWDRIALRNHMVLIPFLVLWLWCVVSINSVGLCRIPSAYFLLIPITVFSLMALWMPQISERRSAILKSVVHMICFTVLAAAGANQMNEKLFLKIRDHFLLSNPVGMKINEFYYDYTLYAARVFKSYDQKLIKTCTLGLTVDTEQLRRIERKLLDYDYLVLRRGSAPADLDIISRGDYLEFKIKLWTIVETTPEKFLKSPGEILKIFSERSDRNVFFRQITFFSLLGITSLCLYSLIYGLFRLITGFFFLSETRASVVAGILCVIAGLSVLIPLRFENEKYFEADELAAALNSDDWQYRLEALKDILAKRIDIAQFPSHSRLIYSPHIPERYWLARAMSVSRSPDTYQELLRLLDDSNFNVVYSALYALGRRGEKKAIPVILRQIEISDNWYVQQYAYKALKSLGWRQRSVIGG
jgi:hypothetical protein